MTYENRSNTRQGHKAYYCHLCQNLVEGYSNPLIGRENRYMLQDQGWVNVLRIYERCHACQRLHSDKEYPRLIIPVAVINLARQRYQLRRDRQYQEADRIRDDLLEMGFRLAENKNSLEIIARSGESVTVTLLGVG